MSKVCCDFLIHQLAFYKDAIRPCCSFSIDKYRLFNQNFNGNLSELEKYLEIRKEYIDIFANGSMPPCFKDCTTHEFIPFDENRALVLNNIIVSNRSKCSCNCIYCECVDHGEGADKQAYKRWLNTRKPYDIKPLLDYLKDNNNIAEGCRFIICGGECSEYPEEELAYLVYLSALYDGQSLLLTSGIKYSPILAKALSIPRNIVKISVDSGYKETFEKIKRVNAYEEVWKNIKKYTESVNNSYPHEIAPKVQLKYIIIPQINDNEKEVKEFIKKSRNYGCKSIVIDVEHYYIQKNKNNSEKNQNIKKIINLFYEKLQDDPEIEIDVEGVEREWLLSFLEEKYKAKIGVYEI